MGAQPETDLPIGTLSVSGLVGALHDALAQHFPQPGWVAGEVLLGRRGNGASLFFELADRERPDTPPTAKVQVLVRARDRDKLTGKLTRAGLSLSDGLAVRLYGRPELWGPSGSLSFVVTDIDVDFTLGRIAVDREALLRLLESEGVTERQRKLKLPVVPLRVGLITSKGSAAYGDFIEQLTRSGIGFEVCTIDVRVQGDQAVASIAAALRAFSGSLFAHWQPDVVALVRGGGGRAELAVFDTEIVARAVADCLRPVITGIGHEIDISVADRVAHWAGKTPTDCATVLIDQVRKAHQRAEALWSRSAQAAATCYTRALDHVEGSGMRARTAATNILDRRLDGLEAVERRSGRAAAVILDAHSRQLDSMELVARACDPAAVLARGYSITRTAGGTAVADAAAVSAGTVLVTTLARGELTSTVAPHRDGEAGAGGPDWSGTRAARELDDSEGRQHV